MTRSTDAVCAARRGRAGPAPEPLQPARLARPLGHRPLPAQPRLHRRPSVPGRRLPGHLRAAPRGLLLAIGGYDGTALFENLELMRKVAAAGGRIVTRLDLYVPREPPTFAHFRSQRVRQAYDDWAMPGRMAAFLAIVPGLAWLLAQRRRRTALVAALAPAAIAEAGRRRARRHRSLPGLRARCWPRSGSPSGRSASGSRSGAASTAGASITAAAV